MKGKQRGVRVRNVGGQPRAPRERERMSGTDPDIGSVAGGIDERDGNSTLDRGLSEGAGLRG